MRSIKHFDNLTGECLAIFELSDTNEITNMFIPQNSHAHGKKENWNYQNLNENEYMCCLPSSAYYKIKNNIIGNEVLNPNILPITVIYNIHVRYYEQKESGVRTGRIIEEDWPLEYLFNNHTKIHTIGQVIKERYRLFPNDEKMDNLDLIEYKVTKIIEGRNN